MVSKDSFLNKPLSKLIPDHPQILEKLRDTFDTGTTFRDVECMGFRKPDKTHFPINICISPILDKSARVESAILLVKDMSLLKDLQETSQQIDRISHLGTLALGMAHEIKNPLLAISGSAQLLRKELGDEDQVKYMDIVISETQRINRMLERMLDFTRPKSPSFQTTNIHKILEDIITLEKDPLSQKEGSFSQIYDPSIPTIQADEDQLRQVFLNLIQNAIQALPDGGEIRLVTRISSDYAIRDEKSQAPLLTIVVEIIDTGPGIPEKHLNELFTPFFTTKKKGSGLGLAISLKIVEDHGGKMKIHSKEGEGTTVQVFLPMRQS